MKHLLTVLLALACLSPVSAQVVHKMVAPNKLQAKAEVPKRAAAATTVTLTKAVLCYYDALAYANPDYYVVLTDDEDASYDLSAGRFSGSDCHVLAVDFYADATSPLALPVGDYTSAKTEAVGTYSSLYSITSVYDESGKQTSYTAVSGTVSVTKEGDTYTITAQDKNGVSYVYTGELRFTDANAREYVYPQIETDVETTFTGGLAYYYGNLYDSKTGNIYINLYDCDFDTDTGGMLDEGYDLALCAFNRLFSDTKAIQIVPGTYTLARNFSRETYYPGLEVDYMGMTIPFGSYIKQRTADGEYAYGYISGGTFTITENTDDGTYNVDVDLVTDGDIVIKGKAEHITFTIVDNSDDDPGAIISNLEDNVALNLDYVTTAFISLNPYDGNRVNGCNVYVVDISRPSGADMEGQAFETVCDLMRFEFITAPDAEYLPEGTYSVMDYSHLYTNMYEPGKLVQGYFYNGGELTGTRYFGFYGAPYGYIKWIAPAVEGTVDVKKADDGNYTFTVDLIDDAGWSIKGAWTGPMQLNYNPTDAVESIRSNRADGPVSVLTLDGRAIATAESAAKVDWKSLQSGVYLVKGPSKTYKVVNK